MGYSTIILKSFDRTIKKNVTLFRPEKYEQLFSSIKEHTSIARGSGLSYCAASFGNNTLSIQSQKFNRILEFDAIRGLIRIEGGATLGTLLRFIIQKGWYLPVIPGYPHITIGGCIAFNVHGKSQTKYGLFGDYIKSLTIFHPDYGEIKCSSTKNITVYNLTINGFGLTGFIVDATIKLIPLPGNKIVQKKIKCKNLLEAVDIMKQHEKDYDYLYSWNNLNIKSLSFGRGFVYLESFLNNGELEDLYFKNKKITEGLLRISLLNRLTVPIMCKIYELGNLISKDSAQINILKGSFPIYGKEIYFKLFGYKGLREYQAIIPYNSWELYIQELQKLINFYNQPISLGSLKLFKGTSTFLSFCQDGICLAIDVPNTYNSIQFFNELDNLSIKFQAIVNISKDSRLPLYVIKKVYKQYAEYKRALLQFDSAKRFNSLLRKKLEV